MFLKQKKRIRDILVGMLEVLDIITKLNNPMQNIQDCILACEEIYKVLLEEEQVPNNTLEQIKLVYNNFAQNLTIDKMQNIGSIEDAKKNVEILVHIFEEEVQHKLNIVFLPYKASMWDSLASVYEAAIKDESCVVKVVPIPYYQLTSNKNVFTYEGNQFPSDVPIIHYEQYCLEQEEPDVIYVHNIYDNYNTITQVAERYFTSYLKQYTDMLVYVPYHISSFIKQPKNVMRYAFSMPSIKNVDKVILAGEFLVDEALRSGVPKEKLVVLGSPKFDAMIKALAEENECPKEWQSIISGKTVYMLNTGCMFFSNEPLMAMSRVTQFLSIPLFVDNTVVIWRPHPLTETSILKYNPTLYNDYIKLKERIKKHEIAYKNVIFDDTEDYLQALKISDVLITTYSSILRTYLLTEKRVMVIADGEHPDTLLPKEVFYYINNPKKPWFEVIKDFARGKDPLAKNRVGLASKVYANVDGTCGYKVFEYIKNDISNM